jgi:hypothetical protein
VVEVEGGADVSRTNQAFRAWTRGTSFTINMGKTQVITLAAIEVSRERYVGLLHPMLRHFVTAIRGLEDRGLVRRPKSYKKERSAMLAPQTLARVFEPTEPGEHVLALLKCSGVYDELRGEILAYEPNQHGYYDARTA